MIYMHYTTGQKKHATRGLKIFDTMQEARANTAGRSGYLIQEHNGNKTLLAFFGKFLASSRENLNITMEVTHHYQGQAAYPQI
ncbi:hypothetical protein [Bacterioplanoides sp.]|uniref:hypothetical protein n=1 Tax=Bacterioplanoides sp. TaxID=2066072 RepID=UPI003AFF7011